MSFEESHSNSLVKREQLTNEPSHLKNAVPTLYFPNKDEILVWQINTSNSTISDSISFSIAHTMKTLKCDKRVKCMHNAGKI